jgi:HAAS
MEQLCGKFELPVAAGLERERTLVSSMTSNPMIESYFAALTTQLSDLPQPKRDEVIRELRAHVFDRLEQIAVPTDDDCRTVLTAMGTPVEIARQYRVELLLNRSAWKISPWSLLRTLFRWTLTGIQGYVVLVLAMLGYTVGACLYITALLKPLFPRHIGLFVSEQGINLARFPDPPPGMEVLGAYYIPFAVLLGFLFTLGTTLAIRFVVRKFGRLKQKVTGLAASA